MSPVTSGMMSCLLQKTAPRSTRPVSILRESRHTLSIDFAGICMATYQARILLSFDHTFQTPWPTAATDSSRMKNSKPLPSSLGKY
jgi:hypothetical protein